jgi:hypothetical protein
MAKLAFEHASPPLAQLQSKYVVWTRMHAEAGQGLHSILERKERERVAGNGLFFWGVGNPPSKLIKPLARIGEPISVVFSRMKSKPKAIDENPTTTVVWRRYIDREEKLQLLPPHVLITSRGESAGRTKTVHYALQCFSPEPLRINLERTKFNPTNYRNAGGTGALIGNSQVTALLVQQEEKQTSSANEYSVDLRAMLTGSYWVKLVDPLPLDQKAQKLIDSSDISPSAWVSFVAEVRQTLRSVDFPAQPRLL